MVETSLLAISSASRDDDDVSVGLCVCVCVRESRRWVEPVSRNENRRLCTSVAYSVMVGMRRRPSLEPRGGERCLANPPGEGDRPVRDGRCFKSMAEHNRALGDYRHYVSPPFSRLPFSPPIAICARGAFHPLMLWPAGASCQLKAPVSWTSDIDSVPSSRDAHRKKARSPLQAAYSVV